MSANPLDSIGSPITVALYRPKISVSNANGITYRASFQVTEETAKMLGDAKDSRKMIIEASLMLANYDGDVVGGAYTATAGQMCRDAAFHQFLQAKAGAKGVDIEQGESFAVHSKLPLSRRWEAYSRDWLCTYCGIKSRKYLDHSEHAGGRFRGVVKEFAQYCKTHRVRVGYLALAMGS